MPSNTGIQEIARHAAAIAGLPRFPQLDREACFEVFRSERVNLTSILFSGNDWRWRFRSATGTMLAQSEGYSSERACRAAIVQLQEGAALAKIRGPVTG